MQSKYQLEVNPLATSKSAAKRARQNEERRKRNTAVRSGVRTAVRRFQEALEDGDVEEAEKELHHAYSEIDRAVQKGALHKNTASRRKSRLARRLQQLKD
jgi:small subunit ribosomal protein S20